MLLLFLLTGFQGADADSVVVDLSVKADGNIESGSRGVVFIDEIVSSVIKTLMAADSKFHSQHNPPY
jgi:ATP-dependent protease Clp ATPase subunit